MSTALRFSFLHCLLGLLLISLSVMAADEQLPPFSDVDSLVKSFFQAERDHQPKDLISKSQAKAILAMISELGWKVEDQGKILQDVLDDQHVLVATLRSPPGRRFMHKISGRELMYDRLDRISAVAGGPQLIQDLVKLPDGEKYAKPRSGGGVPDLLDLLPKNASGKTRKIADYQKPTGRIYTATDLLKRLETSYRKSTGKAKGQEVSAD